jgi:hypothetical protein
MIQRRTITLGDWTIANRRGGGASRRVVCPGIARAHHIFPATEAVTSARFMSATSPKPLDLHGCLRIK